MPLNTGSLNLGRPNMDFMFEIVVARFTTAPSNGTTVDPVKTWTFLPRHYSCDIMPVRDDLLFSQAGAETVATHTVHVRANVDIRPKDRIQILSSRRLAGPVGAWYVLTDVVEPTETLAFKRAYAVTSESPLQ